MKLKSSYTCNAKIITASSANTLQFEVDINKPFKNIFGTLKKIIARKYSFAALTFLWENTYELFLVGKSQLKGLKAKIDPD
jgi:hypothetical protein